MLLPLDSRRMLLRYASRLKLFTLSSRGRHGDRRDKTLSANRSSRINLHRGACMQPGALHDTPWRFMRLHCTACASSDNHGAIHVCQPAVLKQLQFDATWRPFVDQAAQQTLSLRAQSILASLISVRTQGSLLPAAYSPFPMEALPEFAVLELPPSERDSNRVQAVAAALGGNSVIELPFLRSLDNDELIEACRSSLRIDRLRPGEAICLQGEEADSAYVVLSGTVSCHIRKDLQQMEAAQAYSALVQEFADADEAKAAAADRAADRRSRRQSVIGAACAGAPSAAPSPASPRAGSATASPAMQMQNRQVQNRRQSALGASGSAASTHRAYLMVPGAGDAVESGSFKKRNSVAGAEGSSPGSAPQWRQHQQQQQWTKTGSGLWAEQQHPLFQSLHNHQSVRNEKNDLFQNQFTFGANRGRDV